MSVKSISDDDLGTFSYTANEISAAFPLFAGNPNVSVDTKMTGHIGRVGQNNRLGGPVAALILSVASRAIMQAAA